MDLPPESAPHAEPLEPQPFDPDATTSTHATHLPARGRHRFVAALMIAAMAVGGGVGYTLTRSMQSGSGAVSTTSAGVTTPAAGSGSGTTAGSGTATTKLTLAQIEATVDPALVDITATVGDITATLGPTGTAEGTGMVISSNGEILTNNHVISGATSISVKIGGIGASYAATVVGYDVTHDVAVLQLASVTGLKPITTAAASTTSANDTIVAIGNALGRGGTPVAAEGAVTALDQTVTASDETGSSQETLNGLIQISAAVQPGDSGGATVNAYGEIIGMTTAAASSGNRPLSSTPDATTTTAYAIPIASALKIAAQIESGTASSTVHIGEHALLGIDVQAANNLAGATIQVAGVQAASAAQRAGLAAGDTLISINGRTISSISDLNDTMAATHVGDRITVGWQDSSGQSQQATVTLTTGAA